jgi:hypothetical protein
VGPDLGDFLSCMYAQCTGNGETEREMDVDLLKAARYQESSISLM